MISWSMGSLRFASRVNFSEIAKFRNNFLSTTNLPYLEGMYEQWLVDKTSVPESFGKYF